MSIIGFKSGDVLMHRPHLHDVPVASPLSAEFSLKRLGKSDDRALAELLELVYSRYGEQWDEARVKRDLTQAEDVKAVYGLFWQETLVATTSSQYLPEYATTSGFVHWVATHPDFRGKGFASALLGRVLGDFKERGYESAWLITQPDRIPAIRTYLKFGFVPEYDVDSADHRPIWSAIFPTVISR